MDDILKTGSSLTLIHDLITKLHDKFSLKKLGIPQYFLGLEVHYQQNGSLLLTQTKYIKYLLVKVNMRTSKGVITPMFNSRKLSKHGIDVLRDSFLYRPTVVELHYVTLTILGIGFYVNKSCQYMSNPLGSHWSVVKRTPRYLNGTATHGFLISPTNCMVKPSLKAYSDYDWASDSNDRLPTSGSCIYFRPNLVVLSSNKQSLVVRSCTKVEYHALTYTTSGLLWIESFPNE